MTISNKDFLTTLLSADSCQIGFDLGIKPDSIQNAVGGATVASQ